MRFLRLHRGQYFIHSIENSLHIPYPTDCSAAIKREINRINAALTLIRIAMGQINGMPDLFVPSLNLYIEMKRIKGGVVSAVQKECHEGLRSQGAKVYVAYGFLNALREIERLEKENET